jgi:hypothetical protein
MSVLLASLISEEEMAKALWLSCKKRREDLERQSKKSISAIPNRHITKRMKQMARTI